MEESKDIESLPQLKLTPKLCEIAEEQLKIFIDDEKYMMYRTGNNLKDIIEYAQDLKKYGLVAEEWDKDVENITPKLLLNKDDKGTLYNFIGDNFLKHININICKFY